MAKAAGKAGKVLIILLAVLVALAGIAFAAMKLIGAHRSDPADIVQYETENPFITGETMISAHRSGGGICPEETMMAIRNCVENVDFDVDIFEFDLHITSDGVLVLLHDDTLDRTSDSEEVFGVAGVRAEDKTFEELRQLNFGAKFVTDNDEMPYAGLKGDEVPDDIRIASLGMILDYLEGTGNDYRYIIEIKNSGELGKKAVQTLYDELESRGITDKVAFGTFNAEITEYVDENCPNLRRSASIKEVAAFYFAALIGWKGYEPPCDVLQIPFTEDYLKWGANMGLAKVINFAHEHNMAVQYWTVNEVEDMDYLISMGADCIMSDYPDLLWSRLNK